MSEAQPTASSPPPPAPSSPPPARPSNGPLVMKWVVAILVVLLASVALFHWASERRSHSITDDAFVEAHIVNIAPSLVAGRIIRFFADENDRVKRGQVIAEIDPVPYRDRVRLAESKLDAAVADLTREEADLARLRLEIPIQIEIAKRTLAAGQADQAKSEEGLKLTRDDVETGINEARAATAAAQAELVLAHQEYDRFTSLFRQDAVSLRRSQEVTRSRDAAQAQVNLAQAKLAKALSSRGQIDVAERTRDAAQRSVEKAAKGVDLSRTGQDQIHVLELVVEVKKRTVEEARRGLESAQHDLEYTRVRAPFPGIIVKRYRNLGDFASAGVAILSMYNPELIYVTANLEETRLHGVAPGNRVRIELDAFSAPFPGRVVWINKSTGAQFALMPRNVVSGEFTKVVQRVEVRIAIERDDRWPQLRAGLSARVTIEHGPGDLAWAEQEAERLGRLERDFNEAAEPVSPPARVSQ